MSIRPRDRRRRKADLLPTSRAIRSGSAARAWISIAALTLTLGWASFAGSEAIPEIAALDLDGVTQVPEDELRDALLTRGPTWRLWEGKAQLDELALEEDMERIARFYRERGYYEAKAGYALMRSEDGRSVRVRIDVEEGPPTRLESVEVENARPDRIDAPVWASIVAGVPLETGQVFGIRDYRNAKETLLQELADAGHAAPSLEGGADVDATAGVARVSWRVDPGPRVRFGPIRIIGLERVDEEIVRRELAFGEGAPYTLVAQRKTQEQLFGLGLFHSVAIDAVRGTEDAGSDEEEVSWPIEVRVKERPPRTLRFGIGYGTEERFRARAEWRHRNFLGNARLLDLRVQYNSLVSGIDGRILQPRFLRPDVRLELDAYLRYETVPAYDALRTSAGFMTYRKLSESWTLRGGYAFEFADVIEARDIDEEEGIERVSTVRTGIRRTTLDDRLQPTRGTWLDFSVEPTPEVLGATASWLTLGAEGRAFHSLPFSVAAFRLRVGAIEPFAGSRGAEVPVFKRFYSGGSTSVRGYKYQKLGPLDADGDPIGGLSRLEGSFELRFPIWWRLAGVAFLDAGLVDVKSFRYPLHDLRYSAGPGVRLSTPVGSLRLDVGFPLNPPAGADRFRFHLAVGHAF